MLEPNQTSVETFFTWMSLTNSVKIRLKEQNGRQLCASSYNSSQERAFHVGNSRGFYRGKRPRRRHF